MSSLVMATAIWETPKLLTSCACSRVCPPGFAPPTSNPASNPPGEPSTTRIAQSACAAPASQIAGDHFRHDDDPEHDENHIQNVGELQCRSPYVIKSGYQDYFIWKPRDLATSHTFSLISNRRSEGLRGRTWIHPRISGKAHVLRPTQTSGVEPQHKAEGFSMQLNTPCRGPCRLR